MRMAPILVYMVYNGFKNGLNADIVYERLMDISDSYAMHAHALTFLCSCMIGKWRQDDIKQFLPQVQLFGML